MYNDILHENVYIDLPSNISIRGSERHASKPRVVPGCSFRSFPYIRRSNTSSTRNLPSLSQIPTLLLAAAAHPSLHLPDIFSW